MRIKSLWTRTKLRLTPPLYIVPFESISISSYDFPFKKPHTHIHLSYVLSSKIFHQNITGGKRHKGRQESKRHFEQGDQGRPDIRWRDRELHAERQTYGSCMKLQDRQTSAAPFCDHEMRETQKQCLGRKAPRSTQLSNEACVLYPTRWRTALCFE